ncbi:DUF3493 domain-containing protein [Oxynema sp. CENA135]|uniref:DUF3493 domain-containing protein n=1 Tax=Oxynema sp. CENA135 TaxID=984206 RepID=UPI0019099459|nr:DUF3493 domain-containing protein [Oxynema sp. CENA135]MBK4731977.1 DUF3493 domain-containing protein [Oxynema sp. CENA135]
MSDPHSDRPRHRPKGARDLDPEKYARLKAEVKAPYRGLRKFIYGVCAASGAIGAFVFFAKLLAGRDLSSTVPNFFFQLGVVALMVWLFRIDRERN